MSERYVEAAFSDGVGTATFFLTDQAVVFDFGADRVRDGVHPVTSFPPGNISGMPESFIPAGASLDAALKGRQNYAGFAYFFRGGNYMRLRVNPLPASFDPDHPRPISLWFLPAAFSTVDAAFNGSLNRDAFCYFFKAQEYVRYIWNNDAVDAGYPKPISNMVGMPELFASGVDAAVDGEGSFANVSYLFKDESYIRFEWVSNGEPHVDGAVTPIQGAWPGLAELLLAGKAKSQALAWIQQTRAHLTALAAGTLSPVELALVTAALATHFHTTPLDTAATGTIAAMFAQVEITLRASATMFRYRTDAEAIADLVPAIDAAYAAPWPPSAATRINFTGNFPRRTERNRTSSILHEAVHVNDAGSATPATHISEWYVSPALAPALGLVPIVVDDSRFATRYDLMTAADALHNPASYATFARHLFFGIDIRENP